MTRAMSVNKSQLKLEIGHFIINATGAKAVTGIGFKGNRIKFEAAVPLTTTNEEITKVM